LREEEFCVGVFVVISGGGDGDGGGGGGGGGRFGLTSFSSLRRKKGLCPLNLLLQRMIIVQRQNFKLLTLVILNDFYCQNVHLKITAQSFVNKHVNYGHLH